MMNNELIVDVGAAALSLTEGKSTSPKARAELQALQPQLEQALVSGWRRFCKSPDWPLYEDAFQRLGRAGFYEGDVREFLPNPAYDNAARDMCRELRLTAAELGLAFLDDTPGAWHSSGERQLGALEARDFVIRIYKEGRPFGAIRLVFPHTHEKFDFPAPPSLEVVEQAG